MPKFKVYQHRDAFAHYAAVIEADSKEQALAKAEEDECEWHLEDVSEFDEREIPLDEIEEIKDDDAE